MTQTLNNVYVVHAPQLRCDRESDGILIPSCSSHEEGKESECVVREG